MSEFKNDFVEKKPNVYTKATNHVMPRKLKVYEKPSHDSKLDSQIEEGVRIPHLSPRFSSEYTKSTGRNRNCSMVQYRSEYPDSSQATYTLVQPNNWSKSGTPPSTVNYFTHSNYKDSTCRSRMRNDETISKQGNPSNFQWCENKCLKLLKRTDGSIAGTDYNCMKEDYTATAPLLTEFSESHVGISHSLMQGVTPKSSKQSSKHRSGRTHPIERSNRSNFTNRDQKYNYDLCSCRQQYPEPTQQFNSQIIPALKLDEKLLKACNSHGGIQKSKRSVCFDNQMHQPKELPDAIDSNHKIDARSLIEYDHKCKKSTNMSKNEKPWRKYMDKEVFLSSDDPSEIQQALQEYKPSDRFSSENRDSCRNIECFRQSSSDTGNDYIRELRAELEKVHNELDGSGDEYLFLEQSIEISKKERRHRRSASHENHILLSDTFSKHKDLFKLYDLYSTDTDEKDKTKPHRSIDKIAILPKSLESITDNIDDRTIKDLTKTDRTKMGPPKKGSEQRAVIDKIQPSVNRASSSNRTIHLEHIIYTKVMAPMKSRVLRMLKTNLAEQKAIMEELDNIPNLVKSMLHRAKK